MIEVPEQRTTVRPLDIEQWRQAFPYVKQAMEKGLTVMEKYLVEDYDIYEKHRNNDPEKDPIAGAWHDSFVDANAEYFLPPLINLIRLFDVAINDIDTCKAAINYESEIIELKRVVDKMYNELDLED